ncbi:MAG: molybdopterin-dependent oxidoreductase [Gemmatimonadetes bacterium]|nr:molybdopterin-dependent oxidoreductase [Gemmatimonadota bacterium]
MSDQMDRRRFLKVLGVSGGGAVAASGCSTDTAEKLIPYLVPPENQVPGIATYYATTCRECSAGCGMHVRVREGRAVKVEGNPGSPMNGGRLCARGQASLQGLYNPDRLRGPMARSAAGGFEPITWDEALAQIAGRLGQTSGDRVAFLTGNEAGTFDRLVNEWLAAIGSQGRVVFEPFGYEALRYANQQVFGVDEVPAYRFADARYVLSFGADFLETWMHPVQYTREFVAGHALDGDQMGRYVHVEPRLSMTGINADEWIAPNPGTEGVLALALANVVLTDHGANAPSDAFRVRSLLSDYDAESAAGVCGVSADIIRRLAAEFAGAPSLAVAGGMGAQHDQAHATAAAVNILNYVAGNVGTRVVFGPTSNASGGSRYQDLADLAQRMRDGGVDVLFVHGTNPAYNSPSGMGLVDALGRVGFKVSFARFIDDTAAHADLILPDHDPLEQWNDYEPGGGATLLQQPVMQPVFDTRQTGDVLLGLAQQMGGSVAGRFSAATYKDYLQDSWRRRQFQLGGRGSTFEDFWNGSLQTGGVHQPQAGRTARLSGNIGQLSFATWSGAGDASGIALIAYPSSVFFDGRGANRPWLQELPDPVSKITWSSWVEIHPETAAEHGIVEGDFVEVTSPAGSVSAPAFVYPGIRPGVIAMPIGQGHTEFGRYATDRGANVYDVLSGEVTDFGGLSHYQIVSIRPTGEHEVLASPAGKKRQMGRGIAQSTTFTEVLNDDIHHFHIEHAAAVPERIEHVLDEWQAAQDRERAIGNYAGEHPRWGLVVDLTRCTGCSACVTACHAENNIPTVGKASMQRGRDMSWLRIERYFEGGEGDEPLSVEFLPMMCQQCGRAPCEPVCPVFAAYHTPDGLNAQIYNRCVGTRYCSNNCPYKVRYFNWFDHANPRDAAHSFPEPLQLQLNPDVTVRSKGVMEKCTFCVQRIRGKQNTAALEGRDVADGEIMTACQQSCPADAITFGNLNDPASVVSRMAASELRYRVLEGLNTDPGVTYLMRVRNTVEA